MDNINEWTTLPIDESAANRSDFRSISVLSTLNSAPHPNGHPVKGWMKLIHAHGVNSHMTSDTNMG
ncbi:hypothetical protein DPMN_192356 [Dreissena polymorpha]|uniref:Uncharacterized protein n=1 Tax=Dreissena polymorpha TaxID=45954 RepID=A0A9D3Y2U7_DREPO|nr:hypothetical protein DPMN_192356 [Dreissena polymorpha]